MIQDDTIRQTNPNTPRSSSEEITWEVPSRSKRKGADWYLAVGVISASGVVSALIYGNFLFAIFIIIAIFTLLLFDIKKPKVSLFTLRDEGIEIDGEAHPYSSFESFWIIEGEAKLIFQSKKIILNHLTLPINEKDSEEIRAFLGEYLPEEETNEPFSAKIMEYLGF